MVTDRDSGRQGLQIYAKPNQRLVLFHEVSDFPFDLHTKNLKVDRQIVRRYRNIKEDLDESI